MFGTKQKKICAVADGEAIAIDKVPDEVFASRMLGDGFAVEPERGEIVSPVDGEITGITETKHAYTITSNDGLEILVHIGIDTVALGGSGFEPLVREGSRVKAGDPVARVDLSFVKDSGYQTVIPVVVTNADEIGIRDLSFIFGNVKGGKSTVALYSVPRG